MFTALRLAPGNIPQRRPPRSSAGLGPAPGSCPPVGDAAPALLCGSSLLAASNGLPRLGQGAGRIPCTSGGGEGRARLESFDLPLSTRALRGGKRCRPYLPRAVKGPSVRGVFLLSAPAEMPPKDMESIPKRPIDECHWLSMHSFTLLVQNFTYSEIVKPITSRTGS